MRRLSSFALWLLLGIAVVVVPIACSSSSSNDDAASGHDAHPDALTKT